MLAASDDVTVVTAEAAIPYSKTYLGDIDARTSYHTYLRGDSDIAMAMAQIQLALANYGTHKEVADGNSDARFDLIAAFVEIRADIKISRRLRGLTLDFPAGRLGPRHRPLHGRGDARCDC